MKLRLSLLAMVLLAPAIATAQTVTGYVIRAEGVKITVEAVDPAKLPDQANGLLMWVDGDQERWMALTPGWREKLKPIEKEVDKTPTGATWSRGSRGEASGGEVASLNPTVQLPPSATSEALRAVAFLTPIRGTRYLNSPIVRRVPNDKEPKYPATKAILTRISDKNETRFSFADGQSSHPTEGLQAGEYNLLLEGGEAVTFSIAKEDETKTVQKRANEMASLVGGVNKQLAELFLIEELLTRKNKEGAPEYLGDVLDLIARSPAPSPHMKRQFESLMKLAERAVGMKVPTVAVKSPTATGIEAIDRAREAILAGQWKQAEDWLDKAKETPEKDRKRALTLAIHYRAVLASEAGANRSAEAESLFLQAIDEVDRKNKSDVLRAHNNFANFLHRQTQERINNHAFQMAAGVKTPLFAAVQTWVRAREEYEEAFTAATSPERPSVRMNQARLMALLADLVRTLDALDPKAKQFGELVSLITRAAHVLAAEAGTGTSDDPLIKGIALELRAQLAFRSGETDQCRKLATEAIPVYVAEGFLAGVEQLVRLLGQNAMQASDAKSALRHFESSHLIGELLRDRLSAEGTGQTQAGFFARRAFVLDAIVELKIQEKQYTEALQYAELAKARALQDVLASRSDGPVKARPLVDILKSWPAKAAAVEYFLGREKAWCFVVRVDGSVMAYALPVAPRELLSNIQTFLHDIEGYAPRMLNAYLATKKFDNSWQDLLFDFRKALIPDAALEDLRKADVVAIVPQHILHYFPFTALVTQVEEKPDPKKVARPRFLIDEKFVLVNVPSLTSWDMLHRVKPASMKEANAVGLVQAPGEAELPGVETDLTNLKDAFGSRVKAILTEKDATVGKTRKLLNRPGLLLLATHGFNEADKPLDSFLLLLADPETPRGDTEPNDGRLRAKTIFQSRIEPDLVIMSACYTGLADRSPLPGDDLFGLQRAFIHGGARTVLAGYWDVYDGTAPELLGAAMKLMGGGQPIGASLKKAQFDFLEKYRLSKRAEPYLHPYFWAVYSLLGDERTAFAK